MQIGTKQCLFQRKFNRPRNWQGVIDCRGKNSGNTASGLRRVAEQLPRVGKLTQQAAHRSISAHGAPLAAAARWLSSQRREHRTACDGGASIVSTSGALPWLARPLQPLRRRHCGPCARGGSPQCPGEDGPGYNPRPRRFRAR